jgi:hypothetical protein
LCAIQLLVSEIYAPVRVHYYILNKPISLNIDHIGADEIKAQKWFQTFDFDKMLDRQMKAPWVPKLKG